MSPLRIVKTVRSVCYTGLVYIVSRSRKHPLVKALRWLALAVIKACENCSFDMRVDGERGVLVRLSKLPNFRAFLDVGANHGDWTQQVLKIFPNATVHCFELAPPVFAILRKNLPSGSRVRLNGFGLAERSQRVRIAFRAIDDGLTSLLSPVISDSTAEVIEAEVRSGDEYLVEAGLQEIDFLKVDVEGAEPLVFAGFREAFKARKFRCVQFEFGHSTTSLREFYAFFQEHGYTVGKIFPDGCEFDGYVPAREIVASNYLAVRNDEPAILAALQVRRSSRSVRIRP